MSTRMHERSEMLLLADINGGIRAGHPRLRDRIGVALHADRIDRELASGASPDANLAFALRAQRLTSTPARRSLARGLQHLIAQAKVPTASAFSSAPLQRHRVLDNLADLEELCRCLSSAGPVSVRGVALTRELLTDGSGPLYRRACHDDLGARARQAIDALDAFDSTFCG